MLLLSTAPTEGIIPTQMWHTVKISTTLPLRTQIYSKAKASITRICIVNGFYLCVQVFFFLFDLLLLPDASQITVQSVKWCKRSQCQEAYSPLPTNKLLYNQTHCGLLGQLMACVIVNVNVPVFVWPGVFASFVLKCCLGRKGLVLTF